MTRAFGNVEAKQKIFGGIPEVISVKPDLFFREYTYDFLVMGTDGLFSNLSNEEITEFVGRKLHAKKLSVESLKGIAVELVEFSISRGAQDNVTVILLVRDEFFEGI